MKKKNLAKGTMNLTAEKALCELDAPRKKDDDGDGMETRRKMNYPVVVAVLEDEACDGRRQTTQRYSAI